MTQRKKESALGRGLDALIRNDIVEDDKKAKSKKPSKKKSLKVSNKATKKPKKQEEAVNKIQSEKESKDNKQIDLIDESLIENVILEVHKNPRISLWSAKSAAVLRLLKKTKPEFSISKEASALIEDAVKDKYPDLWEVFEEKKI
jgi:hypothetical protein